MTRHAIKARRPRTDARELAAFTSRQTDGYLEDAAHYPDGHAAGIVFPRNEAEVATAVAAASKVLPIGAQSSLTGAATPRGEVLLSTARMNAILVHGAHSVTLQPGVPLLTMQEHLAERGLAYPPATTFTGAFLGGTVATNAAGAATFKYGTTRDWVEALTIVLASGDVLDVRRGETFAHPDGYFDIELRAGTIRVPLPTYRMPDVPKCSAGYHAAPGMDLIDLFIGSEGTLGVITQIELRVAPHAATAWLLVPSPSERIAIDIAREAREASADVNVAAIENIDRRCIDLLREDGADKKDAVTVPHGTDTLLLIQFEVAANNVATDALVDEPSCQRLFSILEARQVFDHTELAAPADRRRIDRFIAVREAVPAAVNARVGRAKAAVDSRIQKTAADMIVPFDRFEEMMAEYRRAFESRGLDYAIWGHISDGNVHPNVIPRSYEDVVKGVEAILEVGRRVIALGGCPLAEHGVGRNPTKQALLRALYGRNGIDAMRAVKRALDPEWKLSPGVIFEPPSN